MRRAFSLVKAKAVRDRLDADRSVARKMILVKVRREVGRGHEVDVVVLAAVVLDSSSRVLLSKRKNDAGIQYAFHLFSVFHAYGILSKETRCIKMRFSGMSCAIGNERVGSRLDEISSERACVCTIAFTWCFLWRFVAT